ncbi:MAG: rRNA maturation RNase YbeY [Candidatus Eiseniibacteriota bacterium]
MPISLAKAGARRLVLAPDVRARFTIYGRRVLRREGVRQEDVSVILADDALLRRLNRTYRSKDRATDVLSFTYTDRIGTNGARALEGEIFISLDRLLVQARRYRHGPGRELLRLVTHGLLHLCGHDHMKPGERQIMRAAEKKALAGDLPPRGEAAFEAVVRAGLA